MAISRVDTTVTTTAATATSITPAAPVGVIAGDLIVVRASLSKASTTWAGTSYAGWTMLQTGTIDGSLITQLMYRIADGTSADVPPNMPLTATQTSSMTATAAAYRGVDTTTPFIAQNSQPQAVSSVSHPAPALTNTNAGAWGVYGSTARQVASPLTWTATAPLVEQEDAETGIANTNNSAITWADTNGPVATGSVTYTADTNTATGVATTWAGLLNPATASSPAVTFVAAGTTGAASGPSGVATAGLPAGVQAGDVLVAVVGTARGAASGSASFTTTAQWHSLQTRGVNSGSTNAALSWGTRIYVPGDPTSYSFTLNAAEAANTAIEAYILAFRGVDHSSLTWMGGVSSGSPSTSGVVSTDVIPPAATIIDNHDGAMAVAIVSAIGIGGPYTVSTPTGWTAAKQDETALGPVGNSLSTFYKAYAAGVTVTEAVTVTGTSSTKGGHQIVLNGARPAQTGVGARVRGATQHAVHWNVATMPVNKPIGTVTGDLMIAVGSVDNGANPADLVPPDASWTEFASGSVTGAGGAGYYKAWWKFATASEPTSYVWNKGVDAYGAIGIVTFFGAGVPFRWTFMATGTATGSPTVDPVQGEVNSQLLGVILAGDGSTGYRSLATPTAMTEWVDARAPVAGGWIVLGMWTEALTSGAFTSQRASTLLTQTSNLVAPAGGATDPYAGFAAVIPAGGTGGLAQAGSGALVLVPTKVDAAGALTRTGSGTLALTGKPGVGGALARDGSGQATFGGVARPAAALAQAGSGQATFGPSAMFARATLAQTGLGSLTIAGGGGAGALAVNGSGSVAFGVTPRPAQALAVAGSGALTLGQSRITVGGPLARTGSGSLAFAGKPAMFGTLARTGSGVLNLGRGAFTTALQAWDAATSSWQPVLVMGRDAAASLWKAVAGRRASVAAAMPIVSGPVYSDGAGAAGVFSRLREFGPTGDFIRRMARGPGGMGWGAYIAADLPGNYGVIPAGTWVEVRWWMRASPTQGSLVFQIIDDPAASTVSAGVTYPTTTGWVEHSHKVKTLVDWYPGGQRFRGGLNDVPGGWVDISDVRIRTWT